MFRSSPTYLIVLYQQIKIHATHMVVVCNRTRYDNMQPGVASQTIGPLSLEQSQLRYSIRTCAFLILCESCGRVILEPPDASRLNIYCAGVIVPPPFPVETHLLTIT